MDKRSLTDKILQVLTLVPLPFVPQAAQVASAVLAISHEAHREAAAAGLPPPTLAALQAAVDAALPLAQEPWRRIKKTAEEELKGTETAGESDLSGPVQDEATAINTGATNDPGD